MWQAHAEKEKVKKEKDGGKALQLSTAAARAVASIGLSLAAHGCCNNKKPPQLLSPTLIRLAVGCQIRSHRQNTKTSKP
jgi:anthranilate phosphoribosyltransferase